MTSTLLATQNQMINIPFLTIEPISPYQKANDFLSQTPKSDKTTLRLIHFKNDNGVQKQTLCVYKKTPQNIYHIKNTQELLDYAIKWVRSVYPDTLFYPIHNAGTLVFIFPNKEHKFVQFIHQKASPSSTQELFKSILKQEDIFVFKNMRDFISWMKQMHHSSQNISAIQ